MIQLFKGRWRSSLLYAAVPLFLALGCSVAKHEGDLGAGDRLGTTNINHQQRSTEGSEDPVFRMTTLYTLRLRAGRVTVPMDLESSADIERVVVEMYRGSRLVSTATWEPVDGTHHDFELSTVFTGQSCPCMVRARVRARGRDWVFNPIAEVLR